MTDAAVPAVQAGGVADAVREAAVTLAVELCKRAARDQKPIPDRSQLNTLLRAAQGTPSVREVILFVRYQAARQAGQRGAFLAGVADALEREPWAKDIAAVRFFLGSLARAGHVERERDPQRRGPRGGGRG